MEYPFLFWFLLAGTIIASLQDLKRREVDNWLNIILGLIGIVYLTFQAIEGNYSLLINLGYGIIIMYAITHLMYHGRIFAGGDAKLLFALTPLFITTTFSQTLFQLLLYIFLVMIAGSIYGIAYSTGMYYLNKKAVHTKTKEAYHTTKKKPYFIIGGILLITSLYEGIFLILGLLFIAWPFLHSLAKGLEAASMVKTIPGKQLREGDWLVHDVSVGKQLIKAHWEGLTKKEVTLLRKQQHVTIKDGLPFVPSFFFALILYYFLATYLQNLFAPILF